jgi:hypothetical protein
MINALRKCTAFAPDLRVRGNGMRTFAKMAVAGSSSPAQSGGNSTL